MKVIKFLVFVGACGAIEPRLFVASYFVMFPIAVSFFCPATVRLIFLHGMAVVRIVRR